MAISSVAHVDAPHVVTSAEIETELAGTYERLGIAPNLLESLSGIRERRIWDAGTRPSEVAARAGELALEASGLLRDQIGVLINTSVTRDYLEPSTASIVHGRMSLPSTAVNFDLGNACLGFVNGMNMVAGMIERGEVDHGIVVNGECSRTTMESTIARLALESCDTAQFRAEFATLTLGSGAVAMVLSRDDEPEAGGTHRFLGGLGRANTAHADLCVGDIHQMRTDTKGLLLAGLELAESLWKEAVTSFDWDAGAIDTFILHQVSKVHTEAVATTLGLDIDRFPVIYPTFANIGPAGVPTVLSKAVQDGTVTSGDQVMLLGVGSGINAAAAEIIW